MTEAAHLKIVVESSKYMDDETPVGELLFKLMMNKAIIDTRVRSTHIKENLTNLDTYMSTANSNIENFKQYVKVNVDGLKARGDRTDDLMFSRLIKSPPTAKFSDT